MDRDLIEDDREFDMSPEVCAEREERYFRQCLTTDQQFEAIGAQACPPIDAMSSYAKWWIYIEHMDANWIASWADLSLVDNPDEMGFFELNPRYMSQRALHHVTGHYLPANITDTRHSRDKVNIATTTPRMPALGPFKMRSHTCKPNVGICKTCGDWHGEEYRRKPNKYQEADFGEFMQAMANDRATDLSGLPIDLPHVRPTLNVPTPFHGNLHGNNFERKVRLINTGALREEENSEMFHEFMSKEFGPDYRSNNAVASALSAMNFETSADRDDAPSCSGSNAAFDEQLHSEVQDQDVAVAVAKQAPSLDVDAIDSFDGLNFDFGDFGGEDDAMMLEF